MPRLSIEARRRVVALYSRGYSVSSILQRLQQENVDVSKRAIYNLVKKWQLNGSVKDLPRRKTPQILTQEMKTFIEEQYKKNDELTSTAVKSLLLIKWPDVQVSTSTIKRVRRKMGWVCTRPHYCQLLREVCITLQSGSCIAQYKYLAYIVDYINLCMCSKQPVCIFRSTRGRGLFGAENSREAKKNFQMSSSQMSVQFNLSNTVDCASARGFNQEF